MSQTFRRPRPPRPPNLVIVKGTVTCAICLEDMESAVKLFSCAHVFHVECARMLKELHTQCPLCRSQLKYDG